MNHVPFGAFNPRFHGISLFADAERLDLLAAYADVSGPSDWIDQFGEPTLDRIAAISAGDHESRHFHDFLVSPFGTAMMGLRMQASIAGLQAINLLKRCAGKWVPVPLGRWIASDAGERAAWIERTGRYFGIALEDMVALPHLPEKATATRPAGNHAVDTQAPPEEQLATYALIAVGAYDAMHELRTRRVEDFDMPILADSVFEANAYLAQLQAVHTGQSLEASGVFQDFVWACDAPHLQALQALVALVRQRGRPVSLNRLSELFTWAMLGQPELMLNAGHPAPRCAGLLLLAAQAPGHALFDAEAPTQAIFDALDALFRQQDWRLNLASASAGADRRILQWRQAHAKLQGGYFDTLFAVAERWHQDQARARRSFVADPASLAVPARYVTEAKYPKPLVEVRLNSSLHQRTEPLRSAKARAVAVDAAGLQVIGYTFQPAGDFPAGLLDAAHDGRVTTHVMDFAFQDEPVVDAYEGYWRDFLQRMVGKGIVSLV